MPNTQPKQEWEETAKLLVGKNKHSVYVRCYECQSFGINMPMMFDCGNCLAKSGTPFYDVETIHNLLIRQISLAEQRKVEEMVVAIKEYVVPRMQGIGGKPTDLYQKILYNFAEYLISQIEK